MNRVLAFWKDHRNVAVLSVTDEKFLEEVKQWARKKGYRVEELERKDS